MSFGRTIRAFAGRAGRLALLGLTLMLAGTASAQTSPGPSQSPEAGEADTLHAQVIKLSQEGKYAESLPLARRVLEMRQKELGREHVLVAVALFRSMMEVELVNDGPVTILIDSRKLF